MSFLVIIHMTQERPNILLPLLPSTRTTSQATQLSVKGEIAASQHLAVKEKSNNNGNHLSICVIMQSLEVRTTWSYMQLIFTIRITALPTMEYIRT